MDLYATFPSPVEVVFGHLADPSRLGDWLPDVSAADSRPADGTGADFPLTVHVDGIEVAASGEVTAFEPPWLVGYRLFIGPRTHGLRVTCAAEADGTRIHVRQPDHGTPLIIDLARLSRALGVATGLPGTQPHETSGDREGHAHPDGKQTPVARLPAGRHGRRLAGPGRYPDRLGPRGRRQRPV